MKCLFCGSADELRHCACGRMPYMNLNDIYYTFIPMCECGRSVSSVGYSPSENHDRAVRLWNDAGWNSSGPLEDNAPGWENGSPPEPPEPAPPPTLADRLSAYKARRSALPTTENQT